MRTHFFFFLFFLCFSSITFSQDSTLEYRMAQLHIYDYNATNHIGLDERVYQREVINSKIANKDVLVLGSSRIMKIGEDILGNESVLNLGVSMCALQDVIALYFLCRIQGIKPSKVYIGMDPALFFANADVRWKKVYPKIYQFYSTGLYSDSTIFTKVLPDKVKIKKKDRKGIITKLYQPEYYLFESEEFNEEYGLDSIFDYVYASTQKFQPKVKDKIDYLNQLVKRNSLYEDVSAIEELYLNSTGEFLINETADYRSVNFKKLKPHQKNNVMKLNRIILELTYGLPESVMSAEFPTYSDYNDEKTKLVDGTMTYHNTFENIPTETAEGRIQKQIKRPLTIRRNQKLDCPNRTEFEGFVDYILNEGIEIHFVMIPFHPKLYQSFLEREAYQFVTVFEEYVNEYGKSKEITVHGSLNPETVGCVESDFYDGPHVRIPALEKIFKEKE